MKISERTVNRYTVLSIAGTLNASTAPELKQHIDSLPEGMALIVDLRDLDFLDSSGLGALVGIARRFRDGGAVLRLANLNERVRKVFEITHAFSLFDIYDDVTAAAESD